MHGRLPERTCVGCRTTAPKASMLRIVRPPGSATAVVDAEGTAPGRGAYVHRDLGCLELVIRRDGLARALHAGVSGNEVGRLRSVIEGGT